MRVHGSGMLWLLTVALWSSPVWGREVPTLYLGMVCHNEESGNYLDRTVYLRNRSLVRELALLVQSKHAALNFQSDWKWLRGVALYDTGIVVANTNGKNIIKWMTEDLGSQCDPHAHETQYNYADVAYLHAALGIVPTKNVGGFLYDRVIGGNDWQNLEQGIYGRLYASFFWKPDVLWGAGTPNHVSDPQNYGVWKPRSMAAFFEHDSCKNLTYIAGGCANKIRDTTSVNTTVGIVKRILDALTRGTAPDSGFYAASIFVSQSDLSPSVLATISEVIDSLAPFVSRGQVRWSSLSETAAAWDTLYHKKPFRLDCDRVAMTEQRRELPPAPVLEQNFPNPFNPRTTLSFTVPIPALVALRIFDTLGRQVTTVAHERMAPGTYTREWDATGFPSGVYVARLAVGGSLFTRKMVLLR